MGTSGGTVIETNRAVFSKDFLFKKITKFLQNV